MAEWDVEHAKDWSLNSGVRSFATLLTWAMRGGWSDSTGETSGTAGCGSHGWCLTVPLADGLRQPGLLLGRARDTPSAAHH